jgi:hypothetical protein
MKFLKRGAILALVGAAAMAVAALVLHTFSARTTNDSLVVSFSVSGLGNVSSASFTVKADAEILVRCINNGGNVPPGQIRTVTARAKTQSFPARNGRTTGTITIAKPLASEFQSLCPPGFRAVSVDVLAYRNIQLIGPGGVVLKTIAFIAS